MSTFASLAEQFEGSGGDIKNAVLKAAAAAASEPGPDAAKRIHQRHFVQAVHDVGAAKGVMRQSLFGEEGHGSDDPVGRAVTALQGSEQRWRGIALLSVAGASIAIVAAIAALIVALAR